MQTQSEQDPTGDWATDPVFLGILKLNLKEKSSDKSSIGRERGKGNCQRRGKTKVFC
jgi:hypothetical protein